MRVAGRFAGNFLLMLAAAAIILHMMIPHDHHFTGLQTGDTGTCPLSQDRHEHHSGIPFHCHAFNDLAAEKFASVIIKYSYPGDFLYILWFSDDIKPDFNHYQALSSAREDTFTAVHAPGFSSFRAPPYFI